MPIVRYPMLIEVRDGQARVHWKWLILALVIGVGTGVLLAQVFSGWLAALVIGVVFVVAMVLEAVIRRRSRSTRYP
jgi:uncharacterized membrane protein